MCAPKTASSGLCQQRLPTRGTQRPQGLDVAFDNRVRVPAIGSHRTRHAVFAQQVQRGERRAVGGVADVVGFNARKLELRVEAPGPRPTPPPPVLPPPTAPPPKAGEKAKNGGGGGGAPGGGGSARAAGGVPGRELPPAVP